MTNLDLSNAIAQFLKNWHILRKTSPHQLLVIYIFTFPTASKGRKTVERDNEEKVNKGQVKLEASKNSSGAEE